MAFALYIEGVRFDEAEWKRHEYTGNCSSLELPEFIEATLQFFKQEPEPPVVLGVHNTEPFAQ